MARHKPEVSFYRYRRRGDTRCYRDPLHRDSGLVVERSRCDAHRADGVCYSRAVAARVNEEIHNYLIPAEK